MQFVRIRSLKSLYMEQITLKVKMRIILVYMYI